jgi:hypothetical protein
MIYSSDSSLRVWNLQSGLGKQIANDRRDGESAVHIIALSQDEKTGVVKVC